MKIHLDLRERVAPGDIIETTTGRRYTVLTVREQLRGMHTGRQHISCVVLANTDLVPLDRVHRIRWYTRPRKRSAP